jgi:hypothetical protein
MLDIRPMEDEPAKRGRPPKQTEEKAKRVAAYLSPELHKELQALVDSMEPKPSISAVVELAVRQYLDRTRANRSPRRR